ncbi:Fe-S oxidoreductase [Leucobacter exalbidus]|uniref:Fe-S oxidoreductase n=1 Tax=Leucobacter exalbidus TaxID=662960 RepID=UPI001AE8052E
MPGGEPAETPAAPQRRRPLPFAWLGYAYATCVGFVWGAIWSTGPIERHEGLWVFRDMPKWTYQRGGTCVGSCYLTGHNVSPAVLRHERVHRDQWRHYGFAMPLLYALAGRNPLRNRFEIEAGLEDGGYVRRATRDRSERSPR